MADCGGKMIDLFHLKSFRMKRAVQLRFQFIDFESSSVWLWYGLMRSGWLSSYIAEALGLAAVKAIGAVSAIIAGGRLLLRPTYRQIAEFLFF
ncbi:hypothetical protein DM860_004509 [Cuscuta australis]|uniref:Uncharacterized protein n=1 Tax=Cuscuta australis TaxID=267555 RepID=A0A328EBG6_9ASTE|nr:hypothetical protein DM860_004509 [Cuscuta australis]